MRNIFRLKERSAKLRFIVSINSWLVVEFRFFVRSSFKLFVLIFFLLFCVFQWGSQFISFMNVFCFSLVFCCSSRLVKFNLCKFQSEYFTSTRVLFYVFHRGAQDEHFWRRWGVMEEGEGNFHALIKARTAFRPILLRADPLCELHVGFSFYATVRSNKNVVVASIPVEICSTLCSFTLTSSLLC